MKIKTQRSSGMRYHFNDTSNENPFKEFVEFALTMLILPHSNAELECLFSTMNLVKSKLRNRLQLLMLSAILSIKAVLNKCCNTYSIPDNVVQKIKTNETYSNIPEHRKFFVFICNLL
jgi:hypothetical protein